MRIRDVAARCKALLQHPLTGDVVWQNPEERRDFYQTIIRLCQKKEDLFTSPPHDAVKLTDMIGKEFVGTIHNGKLTALDEAKEIIYGDREQTYGRPDRNFHQTAQLWNAYLFEQPELRTQLKPSDVAIMMVLLKVARHANKYKRDNIVDGIGYFACVDRIKEELDGE